MNETHRIATIFAAVFTLIQALVWGIIAIYSVAIYVCQAPYPFEWSPSKITISDLLFLSYYRGTCRAEPGTPLVEAPSAARTYYWMLAYGIISAIWIPTSVLLLVAAISKIHGKYGCCLYIPWIVNTAIIIIVDVCATVIYALDIQHTLVSTDYEEFVKPLQIIVTGADGLTVVPAIEMIIYFSRIIIFWLLNFILMGVVIQGARVVKRVTPASVFVESEVRVKSSRGDHSPSQWVNIKSDEISLNRLPRLQLDDTPVTRSAFEPISPQSPISEMPPTPAAMRPLSLPIQLQQEPFFRESSLERGDTSPVYDVYGKHLGNSLPEELHRHIPSNETAVKSGLKNQMPFSYAQPGELNLRIKKAALLHRQPGGNPHIPDPDYSVDIRPLNRAPLTLPVNHQSRSYSNMMDGME